MGLKFQDLGLKTSNPRFRVLSVSRRAGRDVSKQRPPGFGFQGFLNPKPSGSTV